MASVIEPTDIRDLSTPMSNLIPLLRRWTITWLALLVASSLLVIWIAPGLIVAATSIAIASGLIGLAAMLPSMTLSGGWQADSKWSSADATSNPIPTILIAMAIRVAGTVALFLICRYQMGVPPQTIALMVCGWYVSLTSIEVSLLARGVTSLTQSTESTSE